jgi:hypothetical protein
MVFSKELEIECGIFTLIGICSGETAFINVGECGVNMTRQNVDFLLFLAVRTMGFLCSREKDMTVRFQIRDKALFFSTIRLQERRHQICHETTFVVTVFVIVDRGSFP